MRYKLRYSLLAVLLSLLAINAKSNTKFILIAQANNVTLAIDDINYPEGNNITKMLNYQLHHLSKELHKDHIEIIIEHNIPVPNIIDDTSFKRLISPFALVVSFETNDTPLYHYKNVREALTIYYTGEFNMDKYLQLVYYCLTHIEEIKAMQTNIMAPYIGGSKKVLGVPGEKLNIQYKSNPVIDKVLHKKIYKHWVENYKGKISYFLQDRLFHIVKSDKEYKTPDLREKQIQPIDEEILTLNYITAIIAFPNDYLIYNDTTFYHVDSNLNISGPYTQPNHNIFFEPYLYSTKYREENNKLIMTVEYDLYLDSVLIVFDKGTKTITSNHIQTLLARGWPVPVRPDLFGSKPTRIQTQTAKKYPSGAYVLIGILVLNSITILLSTRSKN